MERVQFYCHQNAQRTGGLRPVDCHSGFLPKPSECIKVTHCNCQFIEAPLSDPVKHIFRHLEADAVLGLVFQVLRPIACTQAVGWSKKPELVMRSPNRRFFSLLSPPLPLARYVDPQPGPDLAARIQDGGLIMNSGFFDHPTACVQAIRPTILGTIIYSKSA